MVDLAVLPAFLLATAVVLVAPGPDMAFMVASGLAGGRRAAMRAAFGITTGVAVYVTISAAGLGVLLHSVPMATTAVRLAGLAYLVFLAWRAWRAAGEDSGPVEDRAGAAFRQGLLVNLSNPKIAIFFTAFLPQFVGDVRGNPIAQLLMLGLVLQVLGLVVDLAVGFAAGQMHERVIGRVRVRRNLEILAAAVYLSLGVGLAVDLSSDLR